MRFGPAPTRGLRGSGRGVSAHSHGRVRTGVAACLNRGSRMWLFWTAGSAYRMPRARLQARAIIAIALRPAPISRILPKSMKSDPPIANCRV